MIKVGKRKDDDGFNRSYITAANFKIARVKGGQNIVLYALTHWLSASKVHIDF